MVYNRDYAGRAWRSCVLARQGLPICDRIRVRLWRGRIFVMRFHFTGLAAVALQGLGFYLKGVFDGW